MKKMVYILSVFGVALVFAGDFIPAQASGYECSAQCLILDHTRKEVILLDEALSTRADATGAQVFRRLKSKCIRLASQQGFYLGGRVQAHLYDTVEFTEDHEQSDHSAGWSSGWQSGYEYSYYRRDFLDFKGTPANARRNCELDPTIPAGLTEEYTGDLPVQ